MKNKLNTTTQLNIAQQLQVFGGGLTSVASSGAKSGSESENECDMRSRKKTHSDPLSISMFHRHAPNTETREDR